MHIHPSSPQSDILLRSEENAAIKIQAGFRGYRVRKQLNQTQSKRKTLNGYQRSILRSRGKRQHLAIMSTENEHSTDGDCRSGVGAGGSSIGMPRLTNNNNNNNNNNNIINNDRPNCNYGNEVTVEERSATKIQAGVRGYLVRKKQKLAADAATKIQAGYRGFKARKEAQKLRQM